MARANRRATAKDGDMRICVDRVVPSEYQPARATAERILRQQASQPRANGLEALDPAVFVRPRAAIIVLKQWENGQTLRCRFLDGSPAQQRKVRAKAEMWEDYANINFRFVRKGDAEIRISFTADPGSWSALGTDALVERYFPKYQPTMNFGWLRDDTDDGETERVVLHEFGHALGLIHEHQSPEAALTWDRAAVYRYFSGPPNYWSREDIDYNILQKYTEEGLRFTRFDHDSIMLYQFDAALFTDRQPTPANIHLSEDDKRFIAEVYPKAT